MTPALPPSESEVWRAPAGLSRGTSAIVLILPGSVEQMAQSAVALGHPPPAESGSGRRRRPRLATLTEDDVRRLKPHAIRRLIVGFELAIPLSLYAFEVVVGLALSRHPSRAHRP
jgi:hypothetical protein